MSSSTQQVSVTKATVWFFGLLGLSLFVFIVYALLAQTSSTSKVEAERAINRANKLREIKASDAAELNKYAVLDKQKGVYQIPIDRAITLEVKTLKQKKVQAGPKIEDADLVPSTVKPPVAVR